jgi:uncharacterized membrane protein
VPIGWDDGLMASLSTAKTLGGVGAILVFIPFVSIVGYILILVAVKEISDDLQDRSIFNDIVIAAVTGIMGALVAAFIVIGVLAAIFGTTPIANPVFTPSSTDVVAAMVGGVFAVIVAFVALVVSAVFIRRAYGKMADRLNVGTFRTAGTLYLVGAALTIVLVGFLVLFIAEILQAVAYFSIPNQLPLQAGMAPQAPAAPTPGGATKFCLSCGNKIAATATFCNNCGAKQP